MHRFASCLLLALALVAGERAAALHGLEHAMKQVQSAPQKQDRHPGSDTCDKCSLYTVFSGAAGVHIAGFTVTAGAIVASFFAFVPAQSRTVVFSRSRAPPAA